MSPETQATIGRGLAPMYNLDYAQARAQVRRLIQQEPENPYGYLFEAGVIWWQSDNEYGLFRDTPTLESLFESDIDSAIEKSEAILRSGSDDKTQAEAHFTLGMALGIRGQWHLLRRRWIRAYFEGKKAVKHLRKCIKHDPTFYDAYLGLGIYDYQAARLPGILKISALLMVRGNEKRGIEQMRLASQKGNFSASQASEFLSTIYITNDHDYGKALEIIRNLREKFPDSVYFQFIEATILARMGDFTHSYEVMARLADRLPSDPELIHRKLLGLLCGLSGAKCLNPEEIESGIDWLTRALDAEPAQQSPKRTLWHFYRGVAYDVSGRRGQAIDDYKEALSGQPILDAQHMAQECLTAPCSRDEVLRRLKTMSLEN